jgi:hypothetical protein
MHELDEKDRIDRRHIMTLLQEISVRRQTIEATILDEIARARLKKRSGAERYWLMMLEWIGKKFPEPNHEEIFEEIDEITERIAS